MKYLIVDLRDSVKDNNITCWVSMSRLAKENNKGNLYHHKSSDLLQVFPIDKQRDPNLYSKISVQRPGALVDVEFAVNDFGKTIVKDILVLKDSPYSYDVLFK